MPNRQRQSALVDPDCKPIRIYPVRPKTSANKTTKCKNKSLPQGPPPTAAESDYIQNGLQLPEKPENLRLLLQDLDKKGFLDKEYTYTLRKSEAVKELKSEIEDRLENPDKEGDQSTVMYKPLLEDMGLLTFADAFKVVLRESVSEGV